MSNLVLMVALLLASCGTDAAHPASGEAPPAPSNETPVPPARVVRAFCGSPDEARLRAAHPEIPPCGNRQFVYVEARVHGHDLLVVGHDYDPCCTDVPSPAYERGAHAWIDGQPSPPGQPLAIPGLGAASAEEASALLSAELLRMLVIDQVADAEGARALRSSWPVTASVLAAEPPALERTARGWRLRVASQSAYHERGINCRSLAVWEAELDGGAVRTRRVSLHSEGSAMGRPCEGEPFPH